MRPVSAPELLAYQYMVAQNPSTFAETDRQQAFVDARVEAQEMDIVPEENDDMPGLGDTSDDDTPKELRAQPVKRKELRADVTEQTRSVAEEPRSNQLAQAWKKTKTTGKGVDIVERIGNLLTISQDMKGDGERKSFVQVRLVGARERKTPAKKPVRPKDGDKNLRYSDCTPEIQEGLRKTRAEEWTKWMKYSAGVVLTKDEVDKLRDEGVSIQPMQWIETDKNAHKRRTNNAVPPLLKSRLVGCGNFEETTGLRTDSPTADVDAHNLVFSFCACHKVKVKSADIQAAYLQGKPVDRIILYRIPKGGIPEHGIAEGAVIAARVPIYGTKDAGRGFWLRLKQVVTDNGFELNKILPTLFALRDKTTNKMMGMMTTNVDDLLYGTVAEAEPVMRKILDAFSVREEQEMKFRFCGKEISQDSEFNITVTAKDNTEKIRPIDIPDKKKLTDKCSPSEITQIRSVVAACAWVARQVRPDLSYRVSRLQSLVSKATGKDMRECNTVLEFAQQTSELGIYFSSSGFTWDDMVVGSITDASFASDKVIVKDEFEGGRSQQGYIIALMQPDVINATTAAFHPICWSSTTIRRACRSTLMAETFAMLKGNEAGTKIRAAVVDAKGELDYKNWEESAAKSMGHVWFTDCDSLYEHLVSPKMNQIENKRLGIDLMALRQQIWERDGERTDTVDHSSGDYPRWIDTSTMLADPLTKVMAADRLMQAFATGIFDMRPTEESLMIKSRNRASRQKKRAEEKGMDAEDE